jgi:hypothetical protein
VLLQSNDLKQALRPYCVGGPMAGCSTPRPSISASLVQAFETEGLIGTGAAPAVLAYLFHRIERPARRPPTLLIIDEGWLALDDEGFAGQLREWLKTLRKKNASVIFATQSLSDIDGSSHRARHHRELPDPALLPNERAIEPQITAIYRRFGLNDRQIEILARATPKRDYYCQSRRGNRLFELGLSDVALALCAASSKIPTSVLDQIEGNFAEMKGLLGEAQSLAYSVDDIEQQFSSTFEDFTADKTGAQLVEGARERWQESLSAFEHSLKAGAVAVDNIDGIERQTSSLVGASKSAVGILQATQAGNELLAVQAQQLADLTAMLAAQGRADALEQARHAAAQEQAREQFGRFMTGRSYSASSVRMFHD